MSLLMISGSLRAGSVNTRLCHEAARRWDGNAEMADLRLPLFDADLEERGIPEEVTTLAEAIDAARAVVVSTPEYNQSLSGVLKNALDWVSRVSGNPWQGKAVALMSAAAGRSGGARASYAARLALTPFRPRLLTEELLLAGARKVWDEDGRLNDETAAKKLDTLMARLAEEAARA
jgi:chromate reductase